ncbi:MAG TPA: recombinase family protein [Clostridiales bacterium]|nr:recombinase family protein [Clostridiales bacterium]
MIAGYIRVSSRGQADNNSFEEQEKVIKSKYPDAKIYKEVFTATKATEDRQIFNSLIEKLEPNSILVVSKLDRFCRNTIEGLDVINLLLKRKVSIHILNMGMIDDSPMGKLIVTVLLAFAEFERNMIVERTTRGKEIARQDKNFREGRPKKFTEKQLTLALSLLKNHTYKQVEEMTGISKSTLVRTKRKEA